MSYTLFNSTSAATDLIAQPGRAVNTFPSGLVRVDQTYLGLTANATAHRATLAVGNNMPDGDTSPCIDGLKIFPEVQERRREDGWTEYIVSAYGRVNLTGNVVFNYEVLQMNRSVSGTSLSGQSYSYQLNGIFRHTTKTVQRVLLATDTYNFNSDVSGVGVPVLIDGYNTSNASQWDAGVSSFEKQNYGHFIEITVVVKPYARLSL
jgi:hypothetical protein